MPGGVKRYDIPNSSYPVGFGYITIPFDVDREKYVQTCLRKERVAIQLDDGGGVIKNCYVSKNILQQIYFPLKDTELGSAVAFIVPKFYNIPIIVGVISKADETQLLDEYSFKKVVGDDESKVVIEGKGKTGELFLNVESDYENGGSIYINLRSKNSTSKFNVNCFGDINIYSEGKTDLKCVNNVTTIRSVRVENGEEKLNAGLQLDENGFFLRDYFENNIISSNDGSITIYPKEKVNLFEGSEPLVKGSELKKQLETMKTRIDRIIQSLEAGSGASSTATTYSAAVMLVLETILDEENFDNINSKKSFTD